jgi:hypothetical protein
MTGMLIVLLAGCGEPVDTGEHVWKSQTDMMNRARETEQVIEAARVRQQQQIEEAAQ